MIRIALIVVMFYSPAYAQLYPGPRSAALGTASAALDHPSSIFQNPAGIANQSKPFIAFSYEQHFLDPDLGSQNALLIIPFHKHVMGLSFSRYGFSEFASQSAGLTYARSFSGALSLALTFRVHQIHISQYGTASAYSLDAGLQFHLTEKVIIGSGISNPGKSEYANLPGTVVPLSLRVGLCYLLSDKVLVLSDLDKFLGHQIDLKFGVEYKPLKSFALRGGMSANPYKQYAGFGFSLKGMTVDAAVSSHPDLGISPNLGLSYEF